MAASSSGAGAGAAGGGRMGLPARSTRGKRMKAAMEEEEEADQEFWNQSFFAEEAEDEDYRSEEEEEDVPDSDFDEPEDEDDDDDEEKDVDERPKRKALKAPEPKGPPKAPKPKPAAAATPREEGTEDQQGTPTPPPAPSSRGKMRGTKALMALQQALDPEQQALLLQEQQNAAPTLRRSTVARVAEAVKERKQKEQAKPARPRSAKSSEWRPMTQAELLAEAARTEVDNIYSLKLLLAMEEETKKKAVVQKQQYRGPLVKWISRKRVRADAPPEPPPPKPPPPKQQQQAPPEQEPAKQAAAEAPKPPADAAAPTAPGVLPRMPTASHIQAMDEGPSGGAHREGGKQEEEQEGAPLSAAALDELRRYEGTLSFELHNMHYPPLWLRRWKAPQPPAPAACVVTGAPAKYRDPQTKLAYASTAAFKRIRGLPPTKAPPPQPPPPAPATKGFNSATCVFPGASARSVPSPALRRAVAALPLPPPPPLAPPTLQLTMVHPMSLPTPLMSMAMDVTKVPAPVAQQS